MIGSVLRKAALMSAVPALVAGVSASPATAGVKYDNDDYKRSVNIKVCKEVKDDHGNKDDKYDRDRDRNKDRDRRNKDKFRIHVKTDKDYDNVWVRDGKCENVYLNFKYASFRVWEDYAHGYKFLYIKCSEGAYNSGYNQCKFDKHDDWVKVTVFNKRVNKHDDDDKKKDY